MDTDLVLPGSIPGLLRRGSPVVVESLGLPGTIAFVDAGDEIAAVCYGEMVAPWLGWSELALDLTDATGRAHAAWWLAWRRPLRGHANLDLHNALGLWEVDRWTDDDRRVFWGALAESDCAEAILDLDLDDPRTLSDGSRYVDAEALRRVVLHVAGVSP